MARIALVSTYPPRRCGIGTFTSDLGRALGDHEIVALGGPAELIATNHRVRHVIRTDVPADFARVARSLVHGGVSAVSVQHEYGIWGANDGEGVLEFLAGLSVPAVATLHTVLRHPTAGQARVMRGILDTTAAAVVMSKAAASILIGSYAADPSRVEIIPHGVPDLPFVEPDSVKPGLGMSGRQVLLSFGLVGPGKGYESVIETMPQVVRAVPNACYVILGATHPELQRTEGERYRTQLETMVAKLGMTEHVVFIDRFVSQHELSRWLEATDVFVTPYPNLDQIVSGTLSYAMAAGKASVSTPYLYASEYPRRWAWPPGAARRSGSHGRRPHRAAAGPRPPRRDGAARLSARPGHALVPSRGRLRAAVHEAAGSASRRRRHRRPDGRAARCLNRSRCSRWLGGILTS